MLVDWSKIETVLLDMDGTILDLQFDNHFWLNHLPEQYAKLHDITPEQAIDRLMPIFRKHEGTLNWYCVDFWSSELELDIIQYKADVADKIGYRPSVENFLQRCHQQIADLRLVTNAHRKVLNLKIEHTQLDQYFSQMICSHELGAPKENQAFWHALHENKHFNPETTLFIDDSELVLDSANDFGIRYILSIAEPDSINPRVSPSKYTMLNDFKQLGLLYNN